MTTTEQKQTPLPLQFSASLKSNHGCPNVARGLSLQPAHTDPQSLPNLSGSPFTSSLESSFLHSLLPLHNKRSEPCLINKMQWTFLICEIFLRFQTGESWKNEKKIMKERESPQFLWKLFHCPLVVGAFLCSPASQTFVHMQESFIHSFSEKSFCNEKQAPMHVSKNVSLLTFGLHELRRAHAARAFHTLPCYTLHMHSSPVKQTVS